MRRRRICPATIFHNGFLRNRVRFVPHYRGTVHAACPDAIFRWCFPVNTVGTIGRFPGKRSAEPISGIPPADIFVVRQTIF